MHQAHFGLDHDIVARPGAVGPGLAITGDAGVNQTRIDPVNRLKIHLIFFQRIRQEIFHQDITIFNQLVKDLHPGRVRKGKADGLFISIDLSPEI